MAGAAQMSRTSKDRLAQDDDEIARLERKLGIKKGGRKATGDGLDDLLGDLEPNADDQLQKRKSTDDAGWLQAKRRRVEVDEGSDEESDFEGLSDDDDEAEVAAKQVDDIGSSELDADKQVRALRENPYVAPSTGKYVPPSLRKAPTSDDEVVLRLRRRVQGLVNRLSESNMLSILQSIEALYAENARQYVTSAVIDTLLALVTDESALTDQFIVLHGGFVAALYRAIGVDFGAQVLDRIVTSLDAESIGKRAANLVSLLATIYNFEVITCQIMYDLIRQYVAHFTEDDTELLLRIIRTCGQQVRQDDPSALKEVISRIQKKASEVDEGSISIRQKFMIDTMNDLRNNRLRLGMASSASRSEFMARMKKLLGQVKAKSSKASEPFSLSLDDIRNSDKKGKWWLIGASYHDPAKMVDANTTSMRTATPLGNDKFGADDDETTNMVAVARALGMNTDVRRAIFAAVMLSTDYKEAIIKIKKLRLKKAQLEEISNVLLRCVTGESTYNPYYAVLAGEFCYERAVKWSFQTMLWDYLKRMDPSLTQEDEFDDETDKLDASTIVSLAKLYGSLIRKNALSITVLKTLDWTNVQARTCMFLEILLTSIILDKSKADVAPSVEAILCQVQEVPDMVLGFRYFLETVLAHSEVPEKRKHKRRVAEVCQKVTTELGQSSESPG